MFSCDMKKFVTWLICWRTNEPEPSTTHLRPPPAGAFSGLVLLVTVVRPLGLEKTGDKIFVQSSAIEPKFKLYQKPQHVIE